MLSAREKRADITPQGQQEYVMKTRVTELLGIKYPIIQGGMQWLGLAELASAVSNAGGLGIINAGTQPSADALAEEIRKTKSMTQKPFAVNVSMLPDVEPKGVDAYFKAVVEGGVPVVETSGRIPKDFIPMLKEAGIRLIHKVASVGYAKRAEEAGADIVTIVGFECAGHPGLDDIPTSVLIPRAAEVLSVPLLAGGGIADGRGLAAALAWGAEGVVIGTRFVATNECPIHENFKHWMVQAKETDTMMIQYSIRNPLRSIKNKATQKVLEMEKSGASLEDLMPIIGGANGRRSYKEGDLEGATFPIGQAIGIIHDIKPVKDVIEEIMEGARKTIARLNSLAGA